MLSSMLSSPIPRHLSHGACTHRQMMACNSRLYVACNLLVSENTINIYELQSRVKSSKSRVISYQTCGSTTLCGLSSHHKEPVTPQGNLWMMGTVCTRTCGGCGVTGDGCSVRGPNPGVTCEVPYLSEALDLAVNPGLDEGSSDA